MGYIGFIVSGYIVLNAYSQTKNMELSQREKLLEEREMRLGIRDEELEVAYRKLAHNLQKAANYESGEKHKVGTAGVFTI